MYEARGKVLSTLITSLPWRNDITRLPMSLEKPGQIIKSVISSDQWVLGGVSSTVRSGSQLSSPDLSCVIHSTHCVAALVTLSVMGIEVQKGHLETGFLHSWILWRTRASQLTLTVDYIPPVIQALKEASLKNNKCSAKHEEPNIWKWTLEKTNVHLGTRRLLLGTFYLLKIWACGRPK